VHPDRHVFAIEGDSAFGFSGMEASSGLCLCLCLCLCLLGWPHSMIAIKTHNTQFTSNPLILSTHAIEVHINSQTHQFTPTVPQQVETMARYNLRIAVLVFNNNGIYGGKFEGEPNSAFPKARL
jgi:hypothetical protein